MTNTDVAGDAPRTPMQIPITKGGGFVEIMTDELSDEVYAAALFLGLKEMANRGMSKITVKGLTGVDLDKAKAAAMAKGQENAAAIKEGKIRLPGTKAKAGEGKVSKALTAEARRLAREDVKDGLRRAGKKISHYKASQITAAADQLIAANPEYLKKAQANLESRVAAPVGIDFSALVPDADLVAKAEAKKAKAAEDAPLSAKQAGLTAKAKPKAGAPLH